MSQLTNVVPKFAGPMLSVSQMGGENSDIIPGSRGADVLTGANVDGQPGLLEFQIRFDNKSVVDVMLLLKGSSGRGEAAKSWFLIDDITRLNSKRTKSRCATSLPPTPRLWVCAKNQRQPFARRGTRDLIARSRGKWIFIALESTRPTNTRPM